MAKSFFRTIDFGEKGLGSRFAFVNGYGQRTALRWSAGRSRPAQAPLAVAVVAQLGQRQVVPSNSWTKGRRRHAARLRDDALTSFFWIVSWRSSNQSMAS